MGKQDAMTSLKANSTTRDQQLKMRMIQIWVPLPKKKEEINLPVYAKLVNIHREISNSIPPGENPLPFYGQQ